MKNTNHLESILKTISYWSKNIVWLDVFWLELRSVLFRVKKKEMEFRNFQESDRQKILDFYYENFCKNLPLVKIFGGIPDDELRINFEPTYGSMLEDGLYGLLTGS